MQSAESDAGGVQNAECALPAEAEDGPSFARSALEDGWLLHSINLMRFLDGFFSRRVHRVKKKALESFRKF